MQGGDVSERAPIASVACRRRQHLRRTVERLRVDPVVSCRGWATCKRRWDNDDPTLAEFERLHDDARLCRRLNLKGVHDDFGMAAPQRGGWIRSGRTLRGTRGCNLMGPK